jgi:hypothetical protein
VHKSVIVEPDPIQAHWITVSGCPEQRTMGLAEIIGGLDLVEDVRVTGPSSFRVKCSNAGDRQRVMDIIKE